ncbi:MAG: APC family permease [Limisphaerales bacterium]|jgi:APA family basic amino acid/polyamine antiporter
MRHSPKQVLSLFDSTCLIVGIIIGAGIYQMAPDIAKGTHNVYGLFGIWLLGGTLSLFGALSYAELASALPREGGDYVFLNRAYGPWAGFLFGWAQLAIVRPGDIAVMAFAFATYACTIWDPLAQSSLPVMHQIYAAGAVILLTAINILGVRQGKWTQNLLTTTKALGLILIVAAALIAGQSNTPPPTPTESNQLPFSLALIFVLFTFGGWNEMAYVASEVRNPNRNITRALVIGTLTVTLLYFLANFAFVHALGYSGLRNSNAVATDTVATLLPNLGATLISLLICISALGAVNGLIFTGARISYAVGQDHPAFQALGQWHPKLQTPATALGTQGAIALLLIFLLGSFVNAILYTAATVYSFYAASTIGILILRKKEPLLPRPFRVPGYPVTPLIFAATCLLLIQSAIVYKPTIAIGSVALLAIGTLIWLKTKRPAPNG